MADKTGIGWADATWNTLRARATGGDKEGKLGWFCTRVSPGCANCYASGVNQRFGTGMDYAHQNLKHHDWELVKLDQPMRWTRPRMIFVNSMTDLFHESVPNEMIDQVFGAMMAAPHHVFQLLTKRSERMMRYLTQPGVIEDVCFQASQIAGRDFDPDDGYLWPLRNLALGVSVEDQERASRLYDLARTPAAMRWCSAEPLLGPLDLLHIDIASVRPAFYSINGHVSYSDGTSTAGALDWIVFGGESGISARECNLWWIHNAVKQCDLIVGRRPRVFVKQLGAKPTLDSTPHSISDSKGEHIDDYPEALRRREYPDRFAEILNPTS